MLTESWVEEKGAQPTERTTAYEDCQAKSIQEFGWTSQGMDWGWGQDIKSTTHRRVEEFGYSCRQRRLTWDKRRRTGLLPSGPKSSFQMRASFVFDLETKVLDSGGRVEKLITQVAWSPVLSLLRCTCIYTYTLYCQKYWHPLLMKGLTTLVIFMSKHLNV